MRIGYWKSGRVAVDLTDMEVEKLGGIGARIYIVHHTTGQKGRATPNRTPQFWVYKDDDGLSEFVTTHSALIRRHKKVAALKPDYTAMSLFTGINGRWSAVPDFAMLECDRCDWQPDLGRFDVDMRWSERKPASDRGKKKRANDHAGEGPPESGSLGFIAAVLPARLGKVNDLLAKYPGEIELFIDEQGRVRAKLMERVVKEHVL
jgi:hypothetical protein